MEPKPGFRGQVATGGGQDLFALQSFWVVFFSSKATKVEMCPACSFLGPSCFLKCFLHFCFLLLGSRRGRICLKRQAPRASRWQRLRDGGERSTRTAEGGHLPPALPHFGFLNLGLFFLRDPFLVVLKKVDPKSKTIFGGHPKKTPIWQLEFCLGP